MEDFKMKKLIETINTDEAENVLNKLRLSDVKISQRFRFTKDGLIYIKDTEQGMNNNASAVHTEKEIKTKGYVYKKSWLSVRNQSDFIYEILPDIIKQGGKRKRSGRKKANYETKTISFRVRVEFVEQIKKMVKDYVSEVLKVTPNVPSLCVSGGLKKTDFPINY